MHIKFFIPNDKLADPGIPQTAAFRTEDPMGECTLQIAWIAPMNIAMENISHYMLSITNSSGLTTINVNYTNHNTLFFLSYPLCSCTDHNVSISAINFCDRAGQSSLDMLVQSNFLDRDLVCQDTENHITGTEYNPSGTEAQNTPRNNSENTMSMTYKFKLVLSML